MCETLWVRCNGQALEDWGPVELFDELRKTHFRPRKMWLRCKMVVCLGLLRSRICKFLWNRMHRTRFHWTFKWVLPKRATRDTDIGALYGVGLEDEDEDTDDEHSDQPGDVARSSSFDPLNPPTMVSTSSNPASRLVDMYDVDEVVVKAMQRGSMHERPHIEFKAIGRRHGLCVKGTKGELMQCV